MPRPSDLLTAEERDRIEDVIDEYALTIAGLDDVIDAVAEALLPHLAEEK